MLVIEFDRDGTFEVLYNGPGSSIDDARKHKTGEFKQTAEKFRSFTIGDACAPSLEAYGCQFTASPEAVAYTAAFGRQSADPPRAQVATRTVSLAGAGRSRLRRTNSMLRLSTGGMMRTTFSWRHFHVWMWIWAFCGTAKIDGQIFTPASPLPGYQESSISSVSANGKVAAGTSWSPAGSSGFVWKQGQGTSVPPLPPNSGISGLSNDGLVISGTVGGFDAKPFRYSAADGYQNLGTLGGTAGMASAHGMSGDGSVIVGQSFSSGIAQAFRWTQADGMLPLLASDGEYFSGSDAMGANRDGSVVVGGTGIEPFRWSAQTGLVRLSLLPGDSFGNAHAVSDDGSVVVGTSYGSSHYQAFRWTESGGIVGLGDLPNGSNQSQAIGVSADGARIVGGARTDSGDAAFLWSASTGMRNLQELLITDFGLSAELAGWHLEFALDISGDGSTIVGEGLNPQGAPEGWIVDLPTTAQPVPEPTSMGLMASLILSAVIAARRVRTCLAG